MAISAAELKARTAVVLGAALLAAMGRDRFYISAQRRRGIVGRIAAAFAHGHAGRIGENYAIFRDNVDRHGISSISARYYSDDDLHGFGSLDYAQRADGQPLLEQQRGLIVPLIEQAIASDRPQNVTEIGCVQGDISAHLAEAHPDIKFIGIDLSVTNALKKYGNKANLSFREGYARTILSERDKADIVFASSTFCIFTPVELQDYILVLGARRVILSDPVMPGFEHVVAKGDSVHMDSYMWRHDYPGYFANFGYKTERCEIVQYAYTHKTSGVLLFSAKR